MTSRRSAVDSFEALLESFTAGVNAKCLSRTLDADFDALAAVLAPRADDEGGLLVVGIASFNLLLDFDLVERGVAMRAPKYMEWYAAFGLLVTLVWLYIEILRLLAKLNSSKD